MSACSAILDKIAGVRHGFGDAATLFPTPLLPWEHSATIKKQVHGTAIYHVTHPAQACGEADGLITSTPGVLLHVLTADCLPILLCRQDGKRIGVVHAGWRGLLAGIIEAFAAQISRPDSPANWVAAIGPAAGPCCYEVSDALAEDFLRHLAIPAHVVQPRPRHLALAAIAVYKLKALGFTTVDNLNRCTICATDGQNYRYTSYRRYTRQRASDPTCPPISGRNQYSGLVIMDAAHPHMTGGETHKPR
ncbi:peptidoglycan editing factor PgeF [Martelella alba]|uniref:Purine nucleoside phosphorylase n=1 Tax=Martelella alba TaxID=2590451 RepID=A0ABY2SR42_9HYPH|nr:peptidoglycan editing factor PgeF [Martelella alba]TKI08201.1 peptidoglycan editing factor PgeF [Martelella alba]